MAKINWNKDRKKRIVEQNIRDSILDATHRGGQKRLLSKGLWPINGKNKGRKICDLDTSYLNFIKRTFSRDSLGYHTAITELQRRDVSAREKIRELRQNKKS